MSRPDSRGGTFVLNEESPSSTGQGRRLTAGEGDFKDSATEIDYRFCGTGGKVR